VAEGEDSDDDDDEDDDDAMDQELVGWYSETRQERQVAQRPFRCNFVHFAIGYLSTEPILVVVLH
jgi:hypothetical protein